MVALMAGLVAGAVANAGSGTAPPASHASPASFQYLCPIPRQYRSAFQNASQDTNLPLALLVAVARVESNLDHTARSPAGAQGLLQVMAPTAAELKLDPSRPDTNVLAGARYLHQMLARFDSADLALAAYNAGPGAVERAGGAPGAETLTYVANVNRLWHRYEGCT
jgi:soluble lytic murein transglycosylase-like protein